MIDEKMVGYRERRCLPMIRLKIINILLYSCGGMNGIIAVGAENTLLTVVTALCGILTVILSIMLTSYIAHLGDRESHTAPAYPKGTNLVSEETCVARSHEIKAVVQGVDDRVKAMQIDLRDMIKKLPV